MPSSFGIAKHFDVAIIGAGLTGRFLANMIAQHNQALRIALIDPNVNQLIAVASDTMHVTDFSNRVSAITPTNVEALKHAECWPLTLSAQSICDYDSMTVWDSETDGHIHFDAHLNQHRPIGHIIENFRLLAQMQHTSQRYCAHASPNITQFTDTLVQSTLKQLNEKTVRHLTLASDTHLTATLLVGADGAHSHVRTLHGIESSITAYDQSALVCTLEISEPHTQTARQWFLPTGPLAFLPLASTQTDKHFVSVVWSVDQTLADSHLALDDTAFIAAISHASEQTLGPILACSARQAFPLQAMHAQQYIETNLALIGDAAHVIHPLAGQGVNLGFQDAIALANLITSQHQKGRSIASAQMLARYQRSRRLDNKSMQLSMTAFYTLFQQQHPALKFARGLGMNLFNEATALKKLTLRHAMGERWL